MYDRGPLSALIARRADFLGGPASDESDEPESDSEEEPEPEDSSDPSSSEESSSSASDSGSSPCFFLARGDARRQRAAVLGVPSFFFFLPFPDPESSTGTPPLL